MNPEQEPLNRQNEENELNLSDLLRVVRLNWYWFALSIVVCAAAAFLYLQWAPKQYTRTASVLIKDDTKGSGAMSESSAFQDLGMFSMKSSVDNEVLVFQSKQLMQNVVKRLKLDVSYTEKRRLRTMELYTQSLVHLAFPDVEPNQQFRLTATPIGADKVALSGKTATIINLTLQDVSILRAEDVINTLIAIYNEDG